MAQEVTFAKTESVVLPSVLTLSAELCWAREDLSADTFSNLEALSLVNTRSGYCDALVTVPTLRAAVLSDHIILQLASSGLAPGRILWNWFDIEPYSGPRLAGWAHAPQLVHLRCGSSDTWTRLADMLEARAPELAQLQTIYTANIRFAPNPESVAARDAFERLQEAGRAAGVTVMREPADEWDEYRVRYRYFIDEHGKLKPGSS